MGTYDEEIKKKNAPYNCAMLQQQKREIMSVYFSAYRVDQHCKTFKYSPQTISDERPESPNSPRHSQDLAPNAASFLTAPGHYWGRKPLGSRRNWPLEVGRGSKGRQETALHCNSIKNKPAAQAAGQTLPR